MLYVLRRADGSTEPASGGSLVAADGRVTPVPRGEFAIVPTGRWTSPRSGAVYPHGWRVTLPRHGIDVELTPTVDDQELVTRSTGGVTYWEGSVRVREAHGERREAGRGYVELTGYAGPPPGR
jgi:predicted secreted hydrolase